MNKETFNILREIESLTHKKIAANKLISNELARIDKIKKARTLRTSEMEQDQESLKILRSDLTSIENEISKHDKEINNLKANLNRIVSNDELTQFNKQIEYHSEQLEQKELIGLELLEKIEVLDEKIKTSKTYLKGSLESIDEIWEDIKTNNAQTYKELESTQERLDFLYPNISEKLSLHIQELLQKYPNNSPLTQLSGGCCLICRYTVPKVFQDEVEVKMKIKSCPSCRRIFIPINSNY